MAQLEIAVDDLSDVLTDANIDEQIKTMMLTAMGEKAKACIKARGEAYGIRSNDSASKHILDNIKAKKPVLTDKGGYIDIVFTGKKKNGATNSSVAFFQNYGTRHIKARPFVSDVADKDADDILQSGENIFNHYTNKG